MPEGQMFYSVTYGKNLMGGYASQLDAKQRWMVISYIKRKQNKTQPQPADTTAAAAAKP
jgi:mono/diheme cytochrome c family protein